MMRPSHLKKDDRDSASADRSTKRASSGSFVPPPAVVRESTLSPASEAGSPLTLASTASPASSPPK
eukprot:6361507-Prymnesium_polylepis.1